MKKQTIAFTTLATLFMATPSAQAGEVLNYSVQASKQSAQAVGYSVVGAAKLTSGVVAVPLMGIGEVGKAVGSAGNALWDEANEPLEISDENITVGPRPSVPSDENVKPNNSTRTQENGS